MSCSLPIEREALDKNIAWDLWLESREARKLRSQKAS